MTNYRVVVRHVRYWRGEIHKWSNSFSYTGSLSQPIGPGALDNVVTFVSRLCYRAPTPAAGIWQAAIYNLDAGGTAIYTLNRFDPDVPGSWTPYDGSAWPSGLTSDFEANAEVALLVEFPGGQSKSGKPVSFKKWFHAVPASNPDAGAPQIPALTLSGLEATAGQLVGALGSYGLVMGRGGRFAGSPRVPAFYGNHQMPRGRRRKTIKDLSATNKFLQGLLAEKSGQAAAG